MKVIRSANRKTKVAPSSNFTGTVLSDEVVAHPAITPDQRGQGDRIIGANGSLVRIPVYA